MEQNPKVQQLIIAYNALKQRWSQFRIDQFRDFEYAIGRMIKDSVRKQLNAEERAIFEFQLASQIIEYIHGKLSRDTAKMKAVPVSMGDEDSAALRTQLVNHAIGDKGYKAIAEAAKDAVIGKIGVVNNYWSTKRESEGEYICQRVDPFLVMFDSESTQSDGSDERMVTYTPWHSAEEVIGIYSKYLDADKIEKIERNAKLYEGRFKNETTPKSWYERTWGELKFQLRSVFGNYQSYEDFVRIESGLYLCIEWHDKRTVTKKVLYDPATRDFEILEDGREQDTMYLQGIAKQTKQTDSGEMVNRFVNPTIRTISTEMNWITSICPALMPDDVLMEVPYEVQKKGFALKKIIFRKIHPDITEAQSLMDRLIAPLDFYSQTKMTAIEAVRRDVHPDIVYPEGSIDEGNIEEWKSKKIGKLKSYKIQQGISKPEAEHNAEYVFQMLKIFSDEGLENLEYCGGISLNARGYAQNSAESGTLFEARKSQTEIMISDLFANVKEFTQSIFNFCHETLRQYQTTERMIRLLNEEDNPQWITINQKTVEGIKNDITQGEYDFIPDTAATGETQKRENIAILSQTANLASGDPQVALYLASIIYKNLDIPDGKKLARFIEQRIAQAQGMETEGQFQQKTAGEMQLAAQAKQLMMPQQKTEKGKKE